FHDAGRDKIQPPEPSSALSLIWLAALGEMTLTRCPRGGTHNEPPLSASIARAKHVRCGHAVRGARRASCSEAGSKQRAAWVGEEAVAEAEALAAERDQVLEEIAGLRGLEDQAGVLQEAEAELADLDGRLKEAESGRARAEARCRELTSDVERLSAAGEALEALESLVRRSP